MSGKKQQQCKKDIETIHVKTTANASRENRFLMTIHSVTID